jgi:cytochrome P450 PksS
LTAPVFIDTDLASPVHKSSPYALFSRLREEAPVCQFRLPDGQKAWLVTRYDDVAFALKDERFAKDRFRTLTPEQLKRQPWMPAIVRPLMRNMLDSDPPDHTRLRSLVQKAFTPRRVEAMRDRIESLAKELLDSIENRRQFDLIHDYALPLPATVIAEILGVPAKDRHKFHRWSSAIITLSWSKWDMLKSIPAVWSFLRYTRKLVRQRRDEPADDMVTALIQAREGDDRFSEDELVAMIVLLLIAGHETTVNLVANGMLALLTNPEQLQQLRENPARIESAIEELLRFASPLDTATERYVREDVSIAGVDIRAGDLVYAAISSANRDESQFKRPNDLDITRDPNKHLSFGLGIHFCLGASLARVEGQITINALLQRIPNLQLAVPAQSLKWRRGMVLRGMKSLPLVRS